jgi:hypothetical protein
MAAWAPANNEQDHFEIQVSYNGGGWNSLFVIASGTPEGSTFSMPLPTSLSGNYTLRVVDTDRTGGYRNLDSVNIDHIYLRTDLDPNDSPPVPPSNLTATALSSSRIDLSWSDLSDNERGFNIYRSANGGSLNYLSSVGTDVSTYSDLTVAPNTTYVYQVEAYTTSYSGLSNTASASTPDGLSLSASGYKRRGRANADLVWLGGSSASEVEIFRALNGATLQLLDRVSHSAGGSYTDPIGLNGSFSVDYQVCTPSDLGPIVCSPTVRLIF